MKISSFRIALGLLLAAAPAFAQDTPVSRGGWLISGSAGFSRSHDDVTNQTQTSISGSPTALMFVASRFAIGGTVTGSYSKAGSSSFKNFGIGPSARFYFADSSAQWLPFVSASAFPQWSSSNATVFLNGVTTQVDGTSRNIGFDGSLGLTRILVAHVGLTGEAYYTRIDRNNSSAGTSRDATFNAFGARFGLSVFLY